MGGSVLFYTCKCDVFAILCFRYDAWRMREKERLDRRYKGLYKTYLREFSDLGIDDDTLKNARKKVAAQTDSKEVSTADADQNNEDNEMDAELDAEEMDAHGELLDFNKMKLNGRRRFSVGPTSSQYVPIADDRVRRRSAGNVIPLEVLQQLRSSSMPHLEEHDSQPITNTGEDTSNTPGADNADKECKVQEESRISQYRGRRGRRASLAVTSDLSHSKEMHDIVNPGRKGRRASLAVPSDIVNATRKERRGSTEGPNFQTPTGARLSRRSSIPNIEIPMAYGN